MDVAEGPIIKAGSEQILGRTGTVEFVFAVSVQVAVQEPNMQTLCGVPWKAKREIFLAAVFSVAYAGDGSKQTTVGNNRHRLHVVAAENMNALRPTLDSGPADTQRIVISVNNKRLDSRPRELLQPLAEAQLRPDVTLAAVVDVTGKKHECGAFPNCRFDQCLKSIRCRLFHCTGNLRRCARQAAEGRVKMKIGCVNKTELFAVHESFG